MRLVGLDLENFKIFRKVSIDFAPLTILAGANSSGKSAVLHSLAAMLQSQSPNLFPFEFVGNGRNCSIGGYREIVRGRNTRTSFGLALRFALEDGQTPHIHAKYRYSPSGDHLLPFHLKYSNGTDGFEIKWRGAASGYYLYVRIDDFLKAQSSKEVSRLVQAISQATKSTSSKEKYKSGPSAYEQLQQEIIKATKLNHKWIKVKSRTAKALKDEVRSSFGSGFLYNHLLRQMRALDSEFAYLGPVRAYPARHYADEETSDSLDPTGENCVPLLHKWKKHFPKRFREVIRIVRGLELATDLVAKASADEILRLHVQPPTQTESSNLADVGFGVSQILPVVVADVGLPKGGTLLVNQPEVHLHPSSQAQLADYFAARLKTRNYIIETHSEYLINRLRLLVAKKQLDPNQVRIIYFEPSASVGGVKAHSIQIEADGALSNVPKAFFRTYASDTFSLAMTGFKP